MVDFILLLVGMLITLGLTWLAFKTGMRFLPALICGCAWVAFGLILFELNLILMICCVGLGLYMWIRALGM